MFARLDCGQTNGAPTVQRGALAALFELDQVLVLDAVHNTANEGATDNLNFIAGKHMMLAYAPTTPGMMQASADDTFNGSGLVGAGGSSMRVKRFRWSSGPTAASRSTRRSTSRWSRRAWASRSPAPSPNLQLRRRESVPSGILAAAGLPSPGWAAPCHPNIWRT